MRRIAGNKRFKDAVRHASRKQVVSYLRILNPNAPARLIRFMNHWAVSTSGEEIGHRHLKCVAYGAKRGDGK